MTFAEIYATTVPSLSEIRALEGEVLLEFGTPWCGYCQIAQALIQQTLCAHPEVRHLKIPDGRGEPLGRAYGVTLWPTLVLLRDGIEIGRLTRPRDSRVIASLLDRAASLRA